MPQNFGKFPGYAVAYRFDIFYKGRILSSSSSATAAANSTTTRSTRSSAGTNSAWARATGRRCRKVSTSARIVLDTSSVRARCVTWITLLHITIGSNIWSRGLIVSNSSTLIISNGRIRTSSICIYANIVLIDPTS